MGVCVYTSHSPCLTMYSLLCLSNTSRQVLVDFICFEEYLMVGGLGGSCFWGFTAPVSFRHSALASLLGMRIAGKVVAAGGMVVCAVAL